MNLVHRGARVAAAVRAARWGAEGEPFAAAAGADGGLVFGLCDGYGDWGEGVRGSRIAVAAMVRIAAAAPELEPRLLADAMELGGLAMCRAIVDDEFPPSCNGALCALHGATLDVAWSGAVGVYLVRAGRIERRARPHLFVEEAVANGQLTVEQAEAWPHRRLISRNLGGHAPDGEPRTHPDSARWVVAPGDRVLVASVATAEHLAAAEVAEIGRAPPEEGVEVALRAAERAGVEHEISALVVAV